MDPARRRLLASLGAAAAVPAARRRPIGPRAQAAAEPFGWGVASFDPTTDGVLLWTRVTPPASGGPVTLHWTVASDEALTDQVAAGVAPATADTDHCLRVDVTGLPAGRTWWYAFFDPDGTRSTVGRTRTLAADPERLRLAVVSCSRFAAGGFGAYRALAGRDVDLVVHVGDYIYDDGRSGVRAHVPSQRLVHLDQYRARYAQHRTDPDLQALHARHPMVATWDDHEIAGNAWRDGAEAHDDGRDGPWPDRLAAASQAHEDWLPGRTERGADGRLRLWRRIGLGALAELLVLDTRIWGRDRQPTTAAELAPTVARSLLGADQAAWLTGRLAAADRAPWAFVANQVMFHPLQVPALGDSFDAILARRHFLTADGVAVNPDQWDGYPQARAEVVDAVDDRGGVVVLSGDVHSSWGWEGPAKAGRSPTMVELIAPSVSSDSFATTIALSPDLVEPALQLVDRELQFVDLSSHGYLLVDCTADQLQAEWWFVEPSDAASQRLGGARTTTRTPPMRLVATTEATGDDATTSTTAAPVGTPDDDGGLPLPAIGAGATAVVAVAAGAVALRRRRSPTPTPAPDE